MADVEMEGAAHGGAGGGSGSGSSVLQSKALAVDTLPWVERYRPKSLDELISHEEIVATSEARVCTLTCATTGTDPSSVSPPPCLLDPISLS